MPKKIDPVVRERAVRLVREHRAEFGSLTAAAAAAARQERLGTGTVRRWAVPAEIDAGDRTGRTSQELAEIKELKAKVRWLEEDNAILTDAAVSSLGQDTVGRASRTSSRRWQRCPWNRLLCGVGGP